MDAEALRAKLAEVEAERDALRAHVADGWLDVPKDLSSVIMGCSRRPADAAAAAPADARRGLPPCPLISEVSNRASLSLSLNGNRRQSVEAKFLG